MSYFDEQQAERDMKLRLAMIYYTTMVMNGRF